ncbi:DGQHR domain-containing protein [Shewanella sp. TB7-MNA-CIBAN-0143]|uniref:DGQHR domain-containing protein n=1 Tax=Shewanella sp. TB7-MNA-CIBAN-0143 TaxID=3140465 RepID=UPI003332064E
MTNLYEIPAFKITQPLGTFYVFKMKANELYSISYSARAKYKKSGFLNNVFSPITGTQRPLEDGRDKEIAQYVNSVECAIPNSIVIGANISEQGGLVNNNERWRVEEDASGACTLIIPTDKKLASIIDGQHRLAGCIKSERKDLELLCVVYLDLPTPYQAYLFASINANQKKVSRSLAYELYGFGTENEDRITWSPEKLCVSIVRNLNFSNDSKIKHKIILGAQAFEDKKGYLSLAALVESILRLITSNPKKDRDIILHYRNEKGRESLGGNTKLPLRVMYINGEDKNIEKIIFDFINFIFNDDHYDEKSYLYKTVGVQSLFTLLKRYLSNKKGEFDINDFKLFCQPIWNVDFSNDYFTASGIGKSRILNTLLVSTGLLDVEKVRNKNDGKKIKKLLISYYDIK